MMQRLRSFVPLFVGFTAVWLISPSLWLVGGPFRWASLLWATMTQESGGNPAAYNPEVTGSAGLMQFQASTWDVVMPKRWATAYFGSYPTDDPRRSPLLQGIASALYVSTAIQQDTRWLALGLPWAGYPLLRRLWTHGITGLGESVSAATAAAWTDAQLESRGWAAWWTSRTLTLIPLVLLVVARLRARR